MIPKKCIEKHPNNFLQHSASEREEAKNRIPKAWHNSILQKNMLMP